MLLPQRGTDLVWKITETNPNVVSGGFGKVYTPNTLKLFREAWVYPIWVQYLPILPINLGCFRVDVPGRFFPNCEKILYFLWIHWCRPRYCSFWWCFPYVFYNFQINEK